MGGAVLGVYLFLTSGMDQERLGVNTQCVLAANQASVDALFPHLFNSQGIFASG